MLRAWSARLLANERLRFLAVGGWNTLVGYLVFLLCHLAIGERAGPLLTLIVSYLVSVPHAFATQRWLVFRSGAAWPPQFLRFLVANSAIFAANLILLPLLVAHSRLDAPVAQAMLVVVLTIASYLAHRHFSFPAPR